MDTSKMFNLNLNDVIKGAITAVLAAIIVSFAGVVQQSGFDVFTTDWGAVLNLAISAGTSAFVGYLSKNFFSDQHGAFLGKVG